MNKEQAIKRLEYLKDQRDRLVKQRDEKEAQIRKFEEENKLFYFNQPGKGYLGRYGRWESNPLQIEAFQAWANPIVKVLAITGSNRISKAQWNEEPVLTPSGFVRMGDIKVGDSVYSKDGTVCSVIGVYPQGEIDAYKVNFDDDTNLIVSGEHLWSTQGGYERFCPKTGHKQINPHYKKFRTRTTLDIIKSGHYSPETKARLRHIIPTCDPIQFKKIDVPIHPYIMGLLLGDGGMTASVTHTSIDEELLGSFKEFGLDLTFLKWGTCMYGVPNIKAHLTKMGLHGKRSEFKFIPPEYLYNDIESRIWLLRGLMDTDGWITKYGTHFGSSSERLVDDLITLVRSLGGKPRKSMVPSCFTYKGERKQGLDSYKVNLFLNNINPFRLERKADKYKPRYYCQEKIIMSIEKLPNKLPCTCIEVDHTSHLYVAKDFIVTHNTFSTFTCILASIMGRFPWEPPERGRYLWEIMKWKPPIRIRWVGQDWEKHIKTVLEPKFEELWPKSRAVEPKKNNVGIRANWKDIETRGTIEIMSNNQDSKLFEGWDGHVVCIEENQNVYYSNGGYQYIKDVKVGDSIWTVNDKTGDLESKLVSKVACNGVRPLMEIGVGWGTKIKCTHDHKVWTKRGWVEAIDLKIITDEVWGVIKWGQPKFHKVKYLASVQPGIVYDLSIDGPEENRNFICEGFKVHNCYDEPPHRDIRVACARGLVDHNGREIFAMTLLNEAWIEEEVIEKTLPDGSHDPSIYSIVRNSSVNVGFGVTQEGLDNFASKLTEEERMIRIEGISAFQSGKVLKINKKVHYIERFAIPSHWLIDIAIDIHPKKPQHILFIATDERNFKYVCHEIVGHGNGAFIADEIVKVVNRYHFRVNRIIIDPLSKSDTNNENSVYEHVDKGLSRFGLFLETACKDKTAGVIELNSLLFSQNQIPAIFFFRDLSVALPQIYGWIFDDAGMPSKENDDQCENLYRLALLNTQYYEPREDDGDLYEKKSSQRTKNPVTGY